MRKHESILIFWAMTILHVRMGQGYMHANLQTFLCSDRIIDTLKRPLRGQPRMDLREGEESALIIEQSWNTTIFGKYSGNRIKYDCKFRVHTSQKHLYGLYIVITNLTFRRNETTGKCIDYIQFSDNQRMPSERYCHDLDSKPPVAKMISDVRNHEVVIHVFIDNSIVIKKRLELRMVLTAHSKCQHPEDLLCNLTDANSCISRHFVHDNITNCLWPCRDEDSCFQESKSMNYDATKVTISALTSLIFSMVGAVLCVLGCWKYWRCISAQQQEYEASAVDLPRQMLQPLDGPATSYESASPLHRDCEPHSPKDLPPSYESLFPSR